jgi:hypothetical protein
LTEHKENSILLKRGFFYRLVMAKIEDKIGRKLDVLGIEMILGTSGKIIELKTIT